MGKLVVRYKDKSVICQRQGFNLPSSVKYRTFTSLSVDRSTADG